MSARGTEAGLAIDPLFVGVTRPAMRWGVTYTAILVNGMVTMEGFLVTRNLLALLLCLPLHGLAALLCARDARVFDLLLLWGRTGMLSHLRNARWWRASSYSPLALELAGFRGRPVPPVYVDRGSATLEGP
jgi:type IV secretion system protein VirB3